MRATRAGCFLFAAMTALAVAGCSGKPADQSVSTLKEYAVSGTLDALTRDGVQMDDSISADGNGSFRIQTDQPTTVRLYETGDIDVENARIVYQARIRTEGVEGQVYLEMWCSFEGKGEFFSRALQAPLSGSTEWTSQETPFFLKKGENPSNVKLNLVIDGRGTVWIDDIKLTRGPLGA